MSNSLPPVHEVEGKVAIVTGAASGIGRATAEIFHARGAKVAAEDIDPEVDALACPGIASLITDATLDGSAARAVAVALEQFGRLDVLVNNAGLIINMPVVEMKRADWERVITVNATAAFLHSREAMKATIPNKAGAIVNVASYAAYFRFPTIAAHAASKGALAQLTRVLALEAIPHGTRVNAVGSGDVVTNFLNEVTDDWPGFLAQHGEAAPWLVKKAERADPQADATLA